MNSGYISYHPGFKCPKIMVLEKRGLDVLSQLDESEFTSFIGGADAPPLKPPLKDRAHDIVFHVKLNRLPTNRRRFDSMFKYHDKLNWRLYYGHKRSGATIQITTRGSPERPEPGLLKIYFPPIYAENPEMAEWEAMRRAFEIAEALQEELGLAYDGRRGEAILRIVSQSHAIPHHPVAMEMRKRKITYKSDIIEVDSSPGHPELELVHRRDSPEHWHNIMEFNEAVARGDITPEKWDEMVKAVSNLVELLKGREPPDKKDDMEGYV